MGDYDCPCPGPSSQVENHWRVRVGVVLSGPSKWGPAPAAAAAAAPERPRPVEAAANETEGGPLGGK